MVDGLNRTIVSSGETHCFTCVASEFRVTPLGLIRRVCALAEREINTLLNPVSCRYHVPEGQTSITEPARK